MLLQAIITNYKGINICLFLKLFRKNIVLPVPENQLF